MIDQQQKLQQNLKQNIRYLGKMLGETILEKDGQIRLIEKVEIVANKYADPKLGRKNLKTLIAATIDATLMPNNELESSKQRMFENVM